jgi:uncharacterized protein
MAKLPVLFDANGSLGASSASDAAFPAASDLLNHMDRLGIGRSVVWNVAGREDNVRFTNHWLQDQIDRTPGAVGRLIPSYNVSPTMIYERGAVEDLKRSMKEHRVTALRFTRGLTGFTLSQIETIVQEIAELRPVIFLGHDETDTRDILDFTERFSEVSLVMTEFGWSRYAYVFDLMRRRKNILIDTSWMHTWGAIELAVRHFGADRVLFGAGAKTNNGAGIAALARAEIEDRDRDLIAHGNLERLLRLSPQPPMKQDASCVNNRALWSRLVEGQRLGVDVVDAHVHLGPGGGYVLEEHGLTEQVDLAVRTMESLGIETMVASGMQALLGGDPLDGNRLMENCVLARTKKILGYFAFNPRFEKELSSHFDEYFSRNFFVGFKILCDYWRIPVTDPRFNVMWQYAQAHRLPILIHTWEGHLNSPAMLTPIVQTYPEAQFILAHSGGGNAGRREAETLAVENQNVSLEWCGSFHCSIPWEETLAKVGTHRVVFGTDAMAHGLAWELGRLLSLNISEEAMIPILGKNMRKILSLRR